MMFSGYSNRQYFHWLLRTTVRISMFLCRWYVKTANSH